MRKIGNQTTQKLINILQIETVFLLCVILMGLIINFVLFPVQVNGNSMYPTLHDHDFGISNIWLKDHEELQRYDVVIVKVDHEYWVKRVIGLPGERIQCINEKIYINGQEIQENYIDEDYINDEIDEHGYFTKDFSEVVLGKDEVFLLGDNRVHSLDSRIVGPFKLSQIKAKEVIIIWPLNHGRVVK